MVAGNGMKFLTATIDTLELAPEMAFSNFRGRSCGINYAASDGVKQIGHAFKFRLKNVSGFGLKLVCNVDAEAEELDALDASTKFMIGRFPIRFDRTKKGVPAKPVLKRQDAPLPLKTSMPVEVVKDGQ